MARRTKDWRQLWLLPELQPPASSQALHQIEQLKRRVRDLERDQQRRTEMVEALIKLEPKGGRVN